ncbi:hypothetical protein GGR58DRAFT_515387 [Xylaria digitata]|nr:hypothetical protein GGR58DRAFT_515387 [Xylaria digitata]
MDPAIAAELVGKGNTVDEVLAFQSRLSGYFRRDAGNRFEMEGVIGSGVYGITWKIKYTTPPISAPTGPNPPTSGPSVRHIVLKTDRYYTYEENQESPGESSEDNDSEEESSLPAEKRWLGVLRWAKHIVSSVILTDDPLAQDFSGIASHHMETDHWLYLEWLENGTLLKLANRARRERIRLPNRVLWRLFLCLVRMCIAMGWPPQRPDGIDPQPVLETANGDPYGGIIHGDMHHGNLMFGDFIPEDPNGEHTLTPILKLIDFGTVRDVLDTTAERILAVQENLFDIGVVMLELVTLDYVLAESLYPRASEAKPFRLRPDRPEIMTNGVVLLTNANGVNPYPMFDATLRDLGCVIQDPAISSPVWGCTQVWPSLDMFDSKVDYFIER